MRLTLFIQGSSFSVSSLVSVVLNVLILVGVPGKNPLKDRRDQLKGAQLTKIYYTES